MRASHEPGGATVPADARAAWRAALALGCALACASPPPAPDGGPDATDAGGRADAGRATDAGPPPPARPPGPFRDATGELGLADAAHHLAEPLCGHVNNGGMPGACLLDHDGDGDLDLYLPDSLGHPNRTFRNDGARFVDVTAEVGADDRSESQGCLAFDYDGDEDPDLLVTNVGRDRLYRNDGGVFTDVTEGSGLDAERWSMAASAGDVDGDGDLDLAIATYYDPSSCPRDCDGVPDVSACRRTRNLLYVNEGGTFVDRALELGLPEEELTLVVSLVDVERDGDLDLLVGNDLEPDHLHLNDGTGRFVGDALRDVGHVVYSMGFAVADLDDDGVEDVLVTDFLGRRTARYDCDPGPPLTCLVELLHEDTARHINWGLGLHDFDGDGDLDLFQTSGNYVGGQPVGDGDGTAPNQLLANDGDGQLVPYAPGLGEALAAAAISRGVAFGDLDGDGGVDAVVANVGAPPQVLIDQVFEGRALAVELDSTSAGAVVTVRTAERRMTRQRRIGDSFLGSGDPRLHFALGDATEAEVEVTWLDGATRRLDRVPAGAIRVERP